MSDAPLAALPPSAGTRLADAAAGKCFSSDLSVSEFLCISESGFEPLGFVLGSSVYHVGIQVGRWNQSQELTVLTQALYNARELAIGRMVAEAETLQADGIVGVTLSMHGYTGGTDIAEFMAAGTAVRSTANPGSYRGAGGKPFTSDVSGQEFFKLVRMGQFPVALVLGTCVYHIAHQSIRQSFRQVGQNVEMPLYTQAIYDARELAMSRMQAEAEAAGASGIVGVRLEKDNHVWGEHAVEFLAVGTGVRSFEVSTPPPTPTFVIGV